MKQQKDDQVTFDYKFNTPGTVVSSSIIVLNIFMKKVSSWWWEIQLLEVRGSIINCKVKNARREREYPLVRGIISILKDGNI